MLRVIVEIHPGGRADAKRTIATLDVGNISQLAEISNYKVVARTDESIHPKEFIVRGHVRSRGWPSLLRAICAKLAGAT